MTAIYTTLITSINTTLAGVGAIKAVYPYPVVKVSNYPAAIFFPDAFDNTFESTIENKKTYRFKLFVVVGAAQKDKVDIFSTILPKAVDAVIAAFDTAWNVGTINGHRISVVVSSGSWTMGEGDDGLEAQAELTLEFRFLTTN
jgi:hypothetical protein